MCLFSSFATHTIIEDIQIYVHVGSVLPANTLSSYGTMQCNSLTWMQNL